MDCVLLLELGADVVTTPELVPGVAAAAEDEDDDPDGNSSLVAPVDFLLDFLLDTLFLLSMSDSLMLLWLPSWSLSL